MTTAQVVETSVTVNNNSPIQDYVHPDDQTQPTFVRTNSRKAIENVLSLKQILRETTRAHGLTWSFERIYFWLITTTLGPNVRQGHESSSQKDINYYHTCIMLNYGEAS